MKRWLGISITLLVGLFLVGGLASAAAEPKLPAPTAHRSAASGPPPSAIPRLESTYVPIRPCRIADTRLSSAGILRHATTRPFYVRGTVGFAGQGGQATGCAVPTDATGVTVNATVTAATTLGYMANYPTGTTAPLTNFVSFIKGVNATSTPTFATADGAVEPSVVIKLSNHADAHLILDVTGFYLPQIQALINPTGSIYAGSPRVVSVSKVSTGYFQVVIDSNVNYCTPQVHTYYSNEYAVATTVSGTSVYVHLWYLDSTSHAETPVDDYFYLSVAC